MSKRRIGSSSGKSAAGEPLACALDALRRGEVIVFPTETFYGLGADALDPAAVERVVRLKGRQPESPIAVIVADAAMLKEIVTDVSPIAARLIEIFWPGPLTLVLPARAGLPGPLLNRDGGIGVRISSHPLAASLVRELGRPLTATSANPSGKEPARTVEEARGYFSDRLELFLDGGRLEGKEGSTVAGVARDQLKIIREGAIRAEELWTALAGLR